MCVLQKLWAVCDLAMGLILSKTKSFEMKDFPSEPRIPPMYFKKHDDPNFVNGEGGIGFLLYNHILFISESLVDPFMEIEPSV